MHFPGHWPTLDGLTVNQESPLLSFRELPVPIDGVSLSLDKTNAPNGGYLTQSAPSGGLPHTTASGRGW